MYWPRGWREWVFAKRSQGDGASFAGRRWCETRIEKTKPEPAGWSWGDWAEKTKPRSGGRGWDEDLTHRLGCWAGRRRDLKKRSQGRRRTHDFLITCRRGAQSGGGEEADGEERNKEGSGAVIRMADGPIRTHIRVVAPRQSERCASTS